MSVLPREFNPELEYAFECVMQISAPNARASAMSALMHNNNYNHPRTRQNCPSKMTSICQN